MKCVTLIYFCQVYLVSIGLLLFAIFETFLKLSCSYLDFPSLVTWRSRRVTDVAIWIRWFQMQLHSLLTVIHCFCLISGLPLGPFLPTFLYHHRSVFAFYTLSLTDLLSLQIIASLSIEDDFSSVMKIWPLEGLSCDRWIRVPYAAAHPHGHSSEALQPD